MHKPLSTDRIEFRGTGVNQYKPEHLYDADKLYSVEDSYFRYSEGGFP